MGRKNSYTEEYKREAVALVMSSDSSLSEIATNLGLNYKTLYNWVKEAMPESQSTQAGKSKIKELETELRSVRRELKQTRQERDILKKAAAYFASQKL